MHGCIKNVRKEPRVIHYEISFNLINLKLTYIEISKHFSLSLQSHWKHINMCIFEKIETLLQHMKKNSDFSCI